MSDYPERRERRALGHHHFSRGWLAGCWLGVLSGRSSTTIYSCFYVKMPMKWEERGSTVKLAWVSALAVWPHCQFSLLDGCEDRVSQGEQITQYSTKPIKQAQRTPGCSLCGLYKFAPPHHRAFLQHWPAKLVTLPLWVLVCRSYHHKQCGQGGLLSQTGDSYKDPRILMGHRKKFLTK